MTATRRVRSRLFLAMWVLFATELAGCGFRPPHANEPHAVLKVRRSYPRIYGDKLSEVVYFNKQRAFSWRDFTGNAALPRTAGILIHPARTQVAIGAAFTHQEWRLVSETYTETEYYTDYNGLRQSRQSQQSRLVRKLETVEDTRCKAGYSLAAQAGHTYLVQFTLDDLKHCRIDCYEQVAAGGEGFTQIHCPTFTPK